MFLTIKIAVIMLILDGLWLKFFMAKPFISMIKNITGKNININIPAIIATYICMLLGIRYLGIPNIRKTHILSDSIFYGSILGLFSFGVFDFTNKAIIPGYSWHIAIIDILWGCTLNILTLYLSSI